VAPVRESTFKISKFLFNQSKGNEIKSNVAD